MEQNAKNHEKPGDPAWFRPEVDPIPLTAETVLMELEGIADMNDRSDIFYTASRKANEAGHTIRAAAERKETDLNGNQWVDPAPFGAEIKKLTALFNSLSPTENYSAWQTARRRELVAAVAARDDFRRAATQWSGLTDFQRRDHIIDLTRLHHKIYGDGIYTPRQIVFNCFSKPRPDNESPFYEIGHFMGGLDGAPHELGLNTHPDAGFDNFLCAADVAHHENTHGVQCELRQTYKKQGLSEGARTALRRDGLLWSVLHQARACYITRMRDAYYNHPAEKDAFAQTALFLGELRDALAEAGISLAPPPPGRRNPLIPPLP